MIAELEELNTEERNLMLRTPVLVTILIAGADDVIDNAEIQEAINILQENEDQDESDYYRVIGNTFQERLQKAIQDFPRDTYERNQLIISQLETLNLILPKLKHEFAVSFYEKMKMLAQKIAEASGGVLGYMAVGDEESKYVDLSMINDPSDLK